MDGALGLAIGMTIGVSLNNIALGIGVGVAIGAGLASTQMKKQNSSSKNRVAPHSWGFLFLPIRTPHKAFEKNQQ